MRLFDPNEVEHERSLALWEKWTQERVEIIAPMLLRYEVTNGLYRLVRFSGKGDAESVALLRSLESLPIRYFDTFEMHVQAFRFARRFDKKTSYDGHYVALAENERVSLITADKKLVNTARHHCDFIHYVMEF